MAESIGQIGLDLVVNKNDFNKQMNGIQGQAKKAGAALAAAFGIKKLVDFSRQCLELGSDLAEVQNVVDVTFPSMTEQVDRFAKGAASGFGLSETMAKQFTGTFGAMAKAFGFTESAAYEMGSTLTGLAGDVASFYNISQDEAYTKLKSVFTGETESLKDLGVVMTQTALDAYAMEAGFGKATSAMSEAEKVALRYQFVQDRLAAAQGDFARTSGGWANQVRILKLQFDSLKASIGQGLINLFTPVLQTINMVIGKLATLASAFKAFTELITGNKSSGGSQISGMGAMAEDAGAGFESASGAADDMASSADSAGSAAKKAAKEMKALMGFDKVNKIQEPSESADTGSSGGNASGGGIGGAGSLGSNVEFGKLAEGETVVEGLAKTFAVLKDAVQPVTDALKRLWDEGLSRLGDFAWTALKDFYDGFLVPVGKWVLGEGIPRFINALNNGLMKVDFQKINGALKRLWDVLTPFAINVGEGLLWFWEKVLVPLGTWTASEVVPRFLDTLSGAISITNSIIEALKPLFQWFWDTVLVPVANWAGGVFVSVWDKINEVLSAFAAWCSENPGIIQGITGTILAFFAAWEITNLLSFIQQSGGVIAALTQIAAAVFGATAAKIADKAETIALTALYAKDFIVSLASGTAALATQAAGWIKATALKVADKIATIALTAATAAWNAVCALATAATTAFGAAVAFLTSPIGIAIAAIGAIIAIGVLLYKNWDEISAKAKEVWDFVKQKFEEFDTWLQGVFERDWTKSFGSIGEVFNAFFKNISNIWNSIKKIFEGIITFVSGAFTGNWKKAWDGIKTIFKGIWEGLVSVVKSPVNAIIGIINSLISGFASAVNGISNMLNSLSFDIPDWLGGGSFHLNMPTWNPPRIPYLAQGGFVKANTPRLAMIGDNRHYGEIVAPEDKMKAMVDAAVQAAAGSGGVTKDEMERIINLAVSRIVAALESVGFFLDGEELARLQGMAQKSADIRYNEVTLK